MAGESARPFPVLPPEVLTSASPRILWIELSSKCPFDCIFCSRKTLRGTGEFMDIALFRKLIASLRDPEIIRLNYSGESIHHPDLLEAISVASSTGAFVELVSAFSSLPLDQMEPLVRSGLDRLTVSIHTLDGQQFDEIYRFSSLSDLTLRLQALASCKQRIGTRKPVLDFAFVAMERNLNQINHLAGYARTLGVRDVFVHPVIRRDEIPIQFPAELEGNRLKRGFLSRLKEQIRRVQDDFPDISFPVSTHELDPECGINGYPNHHPGPLPSHARIFSCDQSPWDSVHVLANGDVVTCEVRDRTPLGNLHRQTLEEIWHGEVYRSFRRDYQLGKDRNCSKCTYKLAYVPGPVAEAVDGAQSHAKELVSGWHAGEGQIVWSKRRSRVILSVPESETQAFVRRSVEVRGLLPPGPPGQNNALEILAAGELVGIVCNDSREMRSFSESFPIDSSLPAMIPFELVTRFSVCPQEQGLEDVRELGFALQSMRIRCSPPLRNVRAALPDGSRLGPLLLAWRVSGWLGVLIEKMQRGIRRPGPWQPGLSVLIPESATPDHLERCLSSLIPALAELDEPSEIIVSLNGAPLSPYHDLATRFANIRWVHSREALGFGRAIERGLKRVRFDWVYLLNSDMVLDRLALRHVARWRANHVFAVASQIFFADKTVRRQETGWTGFRVSDGIAEIADITPEQDGLVRGHLYAGGGSSLFRTVLLRRFCSEGRVYNPMYFEDAEWGIRAWREGFESLFVPASRVTHAHRATVNRLFNPEEVDRIFGRNQLLFSLRNGFFRGAARDLRKLLMDRLDFKSQAEIASVGSALSLLRVLLKNARAPHRDLDSSRLRSKFYLSPIGLDKRRQTVLVVTPYAIYPPTHGGARRLACLLRELAHDFDLILLSDEERLYHGEDLAAVRGPAALHLTGERSDDPSDGNDRIARINAHSHKSLRREVQRLADVYDAALVQVEFVELSSLGRAKKGGRPWLLTLHDVLLNGGEQQEADRFEAEQIARFDAVMACCPEDAKLLHHRRVQVVPNAADPPMQPWRPSRGSRTILFLGPFRYEPNLAGIVKFLQTVYNRLLVEVPGLRIQILGGETCHSDCFAQPGVEQYGHTSDVRHFLGTCALTVNPLENTRGSSVKLVESLAAGRVCVSTEAGARGFRYLNASSLVLVPEIVDMFAPIRDLLLDEESRIQQEAPSTELLTKLSWQTSARIQAKLYRDILNER